MGSYIRKLGCTLRGFRTAFLVLSVSAVAVYVNSNRATADDSAGAPYYEQTQQEFAKEGQVAYSQRIPSVQAALSRMYDNDGHYHAFSGLFVSYEPGRVPASELISVTQPSYIRTRAFADASGAGSVIEETETQGGKTIVYSPGADKYTVNSHPVVGALPPLSQVPLSVVEAYSGPTQVDGMAAAQSILANAFLHPATLVTSSFVTDKAISVDDAATFNGRAAWVLSGMQIAGTPVAQSLGDSWRMWVDKATGIILRLEYYSGATMLGWAEFRDVAVDGSGVIHDIGPLHLPATAEGVDPDRYASTVAVPMFRMLASKHQRR